MTKFEICGSLFKDLERWGPMLSKRILFVTDGGTGLIKALGDRRSQGWVI